MKNRVSGKSVVFAAAAVAVFGCGKPALADVLRCYEGRGAAVGNTGIVKNARLIEEADRQARFLKKPKDQVESNFTTPQGMFHLKTVFEDATSIFGWAEERKILVVITREHPSFPKEAPKTFRFYVNVLK